MRLVIKSEEDPVALLEDAYGELQDLKVKKVEYKELLDKELEKVKVLKENIENTNIDAFTEKYGISPAQLSKSITAKKTEVLKLFRTMQDKEVELENQIALHLEYSHKVGPPKWKSVAYHLSEMVKEWVPGVESIMKKILTKFSKITYIATVISEDLRTGEETVEVSEEWRSPLKPEEPPRTWLKSNKHVVKADYVDDIYNLLDAVDDDINDLAITVESSYTADFILDIKAGGVLKEVPKDATVDLSKISANENDAISILYPGALVWYKSIEGVYARVDWVDADGVYAVIVKTTREAADSGYVMGKSIVANPDDFEAVDFRIAEAMLKEAELVAVGDIKKEAEQDPFIWLNTGDEIKMDNAYYLLARNTIEEFFAKIRKNPQKYLGSKKYDWLLDKEEEDRIKQQLKASPVDVTDLMAIIEYEDHYTDMKTYEKARFNINVKKNENVKLFLDKLIDKRLLQLFGYTKN